MKRIQLLDKKVYDKIAAGEIVESPVSVVKELLENSLDAGAGVIEISIENAGMSVIRVVDNGVGIHPDDLEKAFVSHATSKIVTEEDLEKVDSFGFRGEALASISAVSEVELVSKTAMQEAAAGIRLFEGMLTASFEAPMVTGTKIEVRNLFFNLPARKKFISNMNTETSKISDLISRYALGHYDVDFILKKDRQTVIDTRGYKGLTQRMQYILNKKKQDFFKVTSVESLYLLTAVLCSPQITRNNKKHQIFFVNGRLIKSVMLQNVLDEVYDTFMPKGRFPEAVLWLELDPVLLDVNIHPAKTEIRFLNEKQLRQSLVAVLRKHLLEGIQKKEQYSEIALVSEKTISMAEEPNQKKPKQYQTQRLGFSYEAEPVTNTTGSTEVATPEANSFNVIYETNDSQPLQETSLNTDGSAETNITSLPAQKKRSFLGQLRIIGQCKNTFILAEDDTHLYIIDQHVVHERVLFERYSKAADQSAVIRQALLLPVTLELSAREEGALISHIVSLNNLGFEVENFGERTYLLRTIPAGFDIDNLEQFFKDLLENLEACPSQSLSKVKEAVISNAACKASVKASQRLHPEQIRFLLEELDQTDNPHTCPHGRTIIKKISVEELYKYFQRGPWHEE